MACNISGMERTTRTGPGAKHKWLAAGAFLVVVLLGSFVSWGVGPQYGWTVFTVIPVVASAVGGVVLHRLHPETRYGNVVAASAIGMGACLAILLAFAFEGLLCIAMASPLLAVEIAIGAGIGNAIGAWWVNKDRLLSISILLLVIPGSTLLESRYGVAPFEDVVTTRAVIQATPEEIWPHLSALELPPPKELLFRLGVAHPLAIRTQGKHRECVLSTGSMPEQITVSHAPHRLAFRVLSTPPTMKELNPFGEVRAPHLEGYYQCVSGEFKLTRRPDGSTLIEGTSRYRCRIAPAAYWRLWSRKIVQDIHFRVFDEVARRVGG